MSRRLELVDEDYQSVMFDNLRPGTLYEATLDIVVANAPDPQTTTVFRTSKSVIVQDISTEIYALVNYK